MSLDFNPSLWFICKLCRESFPDTDELKAHKLESHLEDCRNIKCIVFEEKLLNHEWIPPSQEFDCNQTQLLNLNNSPIHSDNNSTHIKSETTTTSLQNLEKIKFQNPYVSLNLLTAQKLNSSFAPRIHNSITGGVSQSTEGQNCNFGLTKINTTVLSKRKQSFASQVCPYSPLHETVEKNENDLHKNKIRELLSNAVIIKSEPNNEDTDTDSRVFLEPPDLPIPTAATTSLKVEFIDYDLIATDQNVEIVSAEQPKQLFHVNTGPHLPTPESALLISGRHRKTVKKKLKSIVCQICSASFRTNQKLTEHMLRHSDHRPVECPQCDSKFKTKSNLRVHFKKFHNPCAPFRCQFCGKNFTTEANLRRHELLIHTAERPFQCEFLNCGAEFMSQSNLDSHKRNVHAKDLGLPQFVCPTCGKSFGLRKALNVHMKLTHINVHKDVTHLTHILP